MTRIWSLACVTALVIAACGQDSDLSVAEADDPGDRLPAVAMYYQSIGPEADLSKFGDVDIVVTVRQKDEAAAVETIHDIGAKAYRYVQSYWFPSDRDYDGFDIGANVDWAFCEAGAEPRVGRDVGGVPWYFIDANERVARERFEQLLSELREDGYDGIMFDRGLAALTGADASKADIWYKSSTCTDDPVQPGASLAEAYVGLMGAVADSGLELFQNYGFSPFHPSSPFRPDPGDPACQRGELSTCRHIDSGKEHVDLFLNEAVAHPRDSGWDVDFATNMANEKDEQFGGKVVGLITEGTLEGDVSREAVFFQFARVRLFDMPVAIFTGDDRCKGNAGLCNRHGIFPELNSAQFGTSLTDEPQATSCVNESTINCVWVRQYSAGLSLVNVSAEPITATIDLATDGCRRARDLFSGSDVAGGECVESVDVELPPWSGRPILFLDD